MTDKKTQTENQKRIITGKTQSRGSTGTEPCERAKCPDTQADSGGCRFGEHLPGIPDNGAVADQTGIVKPFQKNLTLVDTSNFSSRRAHLLTT